MRRIALSMLIACYSMCMSAQTKLTLTSNMVINVTTAGDGNLLIDEQTTAGDPANSSGGLPTTPYVIGWNNTHYPATVVFDLQQDVELTDLWFYDSNGSDTMRVYIGDSTQWILVNKVKTNLYNSWRSMSINDTSRYVKFVMDSRDVHVNEIVLYGTGLGNPTPPPAQDSASRIVLVDSMITMGFPYDKMIYLFDEQDSVGDPKYGTGGIPDTKFGPLNDSVWEPYNSFIIDLGSDHKQLELFVCDNAGALDTIDVFTGHIGNWQLEGQIFTNQNNHTWISHSISDTTRFIKLFFRAHEEVNELALYGYDLGTSQAEPPASGTTVPVPDFGNYFMGTCGFYDDPDSLLSVVSTHRQYIPWDYFEFHGTAANSKVLDTNYTGYPNSKFKFSPNQFGANMDNIYQDWKDQGIDVVPTLQQTASYLREGRNSNTKPITPEDDPEDPQSYEEHADYMFQFAARYGNQTVADSLLKLDSTQSRGFRLGFNHLYGELE